MLRYIRHSGARKQDRTGTGTGRALFGYQMRFDLSRGFPMVTTKKLHMRSIIHELLWFLRGDSNVRYLQENAVSIGTSGRTRRANWDRYTESSGEAGQARAEKPSTRSVR